MYKTINTQAIMRALRTKGLSIYQLQSHIGLGNNRTLLDKLLGFIYNGDLLAKTYAIRLCNVLGLEASDVVADWKA